MRPLPILPLLAALALPSLAAAEAPPDAAPAPVAAPEVAPTDPAAVPATGTADPTAVPAVAAPREEPAAEISGPTGAVPARPEPGVQLVGPVATPADRHVVSLAPEVVVPFGGWADGSRTGLGLGVVYAYRATERVSFTGRTGYVVHLEEEVRAAGGHTDLHTHEVPLLAGVRYAPLPRLYGTVEAGLVHFRQEAETGASVETAGGFRGGGAVGAGYQLGGFDVGARLFLPDLVGRDEGEELATGLSLQVGHAIAGF